MKSKSQASAQPEIPRWEITLAWVLKGIIVATAIAQFARGSWLFGLGALATIALVSLPAYLNRENKHPFPVEIEILLSVILVAHLTLGLALDLYNEFDHFDKVLHAGTSVIIGLMAFLIAYALYFTGRLDATLTIIIPVILLLALGIGAFWEILEYGSDQLLYERVGSIQKQQGSPTLEPLDDTMIDLIANFAGGAFGAIVGGLYIRYSRRSQSRRFVEVMKALGEASDEDGEPDNKTAGQQAG
jgi:hypothetical protein